MRRRSRRTKHSLRFDWRRWLANAPPRQFLLVIFVGFPLALVAFSLLFPYFLVAVFAIAFVLGALFMKVGGFAIGTVSFLDRTGEYDAPVWFPYLKWGTAPMRVLDSTISLYKLLEDAIKRR
jgi:hypothetical protein